MSGEVVRWIFEDPYTSETWTVPVNPNAMTSVTGPKNITNNATVARTGQGVSFEGARKPFDWQFSGVILDQDHLEQLQYWESKGNRIYITDHFGRKWLVYLSQFDAIPKRAVQRYWRHDYTMHAVMYGRVS